MKRRLSIVALLMLTTSFSTFASVKYYRSTTDIPFVEMMINMMVAMGMLDRVPVGGYGGYPASFGSPYSSWGNYSRSPWGTSPWGGQGASPWMLSGPGISPWGGTPYAGSPWGGSPYAGSPWGGSPYNAGQLGGAPYGGAPYRGSQYRGSRYGGYPGGGSPYRGSRYGGSPWGGALYGGSPWGASPWGGSPWGGSPWGGSPQGAAPWGGSPYAGAPWGASPFATRPWQPGYASHNVNPYAYTNRWGRRLPAGVNGYPAGYSGGGFPRRISNPLFAESGICPSGLCDRIQVKKALEGVWKNESGETLTIKDNRFDWSDGGERKLSGKMQATIKDLVATVDDYDKEIRYRYKVENNKLITRDDKGMTRVFHRQPEDKGEKL